jgi:CBS domain-containing membrane protein
MSSADSEPPRTPKSQPFPAPFGYQRVQDWLRNFWPAPVHINGRERLRVAIGVGLGVLLVALLSRWWAPTGSAPPWIVASLGASAVLVFGIPSSPLSQPWPLLGGSTLSVWVGMACAALVPDLALASALAVALSVAIMVPLRCLHPPGAALALFAVLQHEHGAAVAAFPVLFNTIVLLTVGIAYNTLTGRSYPYAQRVAPNSAGMPQGQFTSSDLDAALEHYNEVLDISRADLEGLLHLAGRAAFQRTLGELRCADIMSKPPLAIEAGVSLKDSWALMRREHIKALPVVDTQHHVVGIVTVADYMRLAYLEVHEGLGKRLRTLVMGRAGQPTTARDIMSTQVQMAQSHLHVMDLVPLFSQGGHHHIPIVDAQQQLVGIVTQTDLMRTLAAATVPSATRVVGK